MKKKDLSESLKTHYETINPFIYGKMLKDIFSQENFTAGIVIMIFDMMDLTIKKITSNCIKYWGYEKKEMEGMSITNLLYEEDLEENINIAAKNIVDPEPVSDHISRHLTRDKKIIKTRWNTSKTINSEVLCICEFI